MSRDNSHHSHRKGGGNSEKKGRVVQAGPGVVSKGVPLPTQLLPLSLLCPSAPPSLGWVGGSRSRADNEKPAAAAEASSSAAQASAAHGQAPSPAAGAAADPLGSMRLFDSLSDVVALLRSVQDKGDVCLREPSHSVRVFMTLLSAEPERSQALWAPGLDVKRLPAALPFARFDAAAGTDDTAILERQRLCSPTGTNDPNSAAESALAMALELDSPRMLMVVQSCSNSCMLPGGNVEKSVTKTVKNPDWSRLVPLEHGDYERELLAALQRCGAREVREETGNAVDASRLQLLCSTAVLSEVGQAGVIQEGRPFGFGGSHWRTVMCEHYVLCATSDRALYRQWAGAYGAAHAAAAADPKCSYPLGDHLPALPGINAYGFEIHGVESHLLYWLRSHRGEYGLPRTAYGDLLPLVMLMLRRVGAIRIDTVLHLERVLQGDAESRLEADGHARHVSYGNWRIRWDAVTVLQPQLQLPQPARESSSKNTYVPPHLRR